MGLQKAISHLTGIVIESNEPSTRKWPKCLKQQKHFVGKDGETIDLDANSQICGGTFFPAKKGCPCKVTKTGILCASPEGIEELITF